MSFQPKKIRERFFAETVARFLGEAWTIGEDREHPDFIIAEGGRRFGLEVCEVFMGRQTRKGSQMKRAEAHTQQAVDALREQYEALTPISLSVRLLGDLSAKNLAYVVPALIAEDLSTKSIGYRKRLDLDNGLVIYVTRSLRPEWYSVNDRCGYVNRDPHSRIAAAVEDKKGDLARYTLSAGQNIRLLLVADRTRNSGKLLLAEPVPLNLGGFQAVYFLSYPESVTVWKSNAAWPCTIPAS